ncbi:MAG: SCO family protein [Planctomycetota bacterium]
MPAIESPISTPRPRAGADRPGRPRWGSARGLACGIALLAGVFASSAFGQSRVGPNPLGNAAAPMPPEVVAVAENGVEQKIGNILPLGTPFVDQNGKPVKLGDYFDGDKPVILEFAYYDCPLLCPMMMSGIIDATQRVNGIEFNDMGQAVNPEASGDWLPGRDFVLLTISINPDDNPVSALQKQDELVQRFMRPGDDGFEATPLSEAVREGWHFLTGREVDIKWAADAAGFNYAAVPQTNDFAHAAVLTFVSPDGEITRYLPGHVYPQRDFRMALVEASQGKQGSFFDMILQLCYNYDDSAGTYTADALALMKLGGAVTLVTLIAIIGGMFYFESRRRGRLSDDAGVEPDAA